MYMKKLLSFVLFLTMGSSSFAMSYESKTPLEAANFLAANGIIQDQSGNPDQYRLDATITRKEVLKVVMKLSGKTIDDDCDGVFADVINDWGCKYIEAALEAWYIAKNDTFRPDDNITLTEAMKLVQKAKGVEKTQQTSNWQEDYMITAYEFGIIDKKYYNYNDDASRGWIFQIATTTIEKEEEIQEKVKEMEMLMSDEAL